MLTLFLGGRPTDCGIDKCGNGFFRSVQNRITMGEAYFD